MRVNAQQYAANWVAGMQNSTEKMRAGIQAVRDNPMLAAVEAQDKMRARLLAAIDSGKWARNTANVSLTQWQSAMINKGLARIPDGVRNAQQKMRGVGDTLIPFMANLQDQIRAMPNITAADAEARMLAWTRGMREFQIA
jgi:hypothetical protein